MKGGRKEGKRYGEFALTVAHEIIEEKPYKYLPRCFDQYPQMEN